MLKGRKVLITGGAGFIGSHLAERLRRDNKVVVLDNLSTGFVENIPEGVEFVRGDILDRKAVGKVCSEADVVFHLAARTSVSAHEPIMDMMVNIQGTLNVLQASLGLQTFVFASTAAVYGNGCTKEDSPLNPLSSYGISKMAAEKYCQYYQETYGLPVVILRYFNVYGERQKVGVISEMVRVRIKNPFVIYGDGKQTRDFVNVDDVVGVTIESAKCPSGVFNVGTGCDISINELFSLVRSIDGRRVRAVYNGARDGEVKYSKADISKISAKYRFQPKSIEDGLRSMLL